VAIDWITIAAQIVNFLVLVWLLHRFLYAPVMRAIAERENKIRTRLEDAERARQEAEVEAAKLRETRAEIEAERHALLAGAKSEAEAARVELEREAREEVEKRAEAWRRQVDEERGAFVADLRRRSAQHFYALAREALGDLSGKGLNDAVAERFVERLSEIDEPIASKLCEEAEGAETPVRIETSFDLNAAVRKRIGAAIREVISPEVRVSYTRADDLICGIRLKAGGQTIGWSLGDYLDRLEARALAGLDRPSAIEKQAAE
jgi:F-type H+-transporting ATPase subunit b